ncbi:MAG: hypothetical protein RR576_08320 [Oscillospiraceae bacterium]
MKTKQIELSLASAISCLPHSSFEAIATAPIEKMQQHDFITRQNVKEREVRLPMRRFAMAAACCAVMLIVGFGWYTQNLAVDSLITIDVNPSFSIKANRQNRVLELKALNDDAKAFASGQKFKGQSVDAAVEGLFAELGKSKYLNAEKNTVLISVQSQNDTHSKQLENEIAQHIEKALANEHIVPRVVRQTLTKDEKATKEAEQYHTSVGKLKIAKQINGHLPAMSLEKLLSMPMEELMDFMDDINDSDNDDLDDLDDLDDKNDIDDKDSQDDEYDLDDKNDKDDKDNQDDKDDKADDHKNKTDKKPTASVAAVGGGDEDNDDSEPNSNTEKPEKDNADSHEPEDKDDISADNRKDIEVSGKNPVQPAPSVVENDSSDDSEDEDHSEPPEAASSEANT